ncbi:membrane protein [Helicobacter pylori]|nr:membrane protein [Helicobacter pylori]
MGKCFFSLAFLSDFIIDYILVLYFSVVFFIFLFLVVLIWGFIVLFKGFCLR